MSAPTVEQALLPSEEATLREPIRLVKQLYKASLVLWRLGLGPVIGRNVMVISLIDPETGKLHRKTIEYHEFDGRKYIFCFWNCAHWYANLKADPRATIQTAHGVEHVTARELGDLERAELFNTAKRIGLLAEVHRVTGDEVTREKFIADRDRYRLLTFEHTDQVTPPPLEANLRWVWGVLAMSVLARVVRPRLALNRGKKE